MSIAETSNNVWPRWIPVTEKLPDEFERVLVAYNTKDSCVLRIRTAYYSDGEWCWDDFGGTITVTHWMSLPPVPEETDAQNCCGSTGNKSNLKPCPFCGSPCVSSSVEEVFMTRNEQVFSYRVSCANCFCKTPWVHSKEDAIELWNRRTFNRHEHC